MPDTLTARLSSRKLWICLLGMAMAAWLRSRGLLSDDGVVTVLVTGMVGYPVANVAQRAVDAREAAK